MQTVWEDNPQYISGVKQLIISKESNKDDTIRQDAQSIARIIRDIVGSPASSTTYKDFMILLRYRSRMDVYARTLAEYGIPFTVSGSASLNESRQIKELLKLFRLMKDVENQVLIVAVLRGMFFGFSDDDLYHFKEAGGEFDFYEKIPEKLNPKLQENFDRAFCQLRQFHLWTQKLPPVVAMEKIIIDSGLLSHSCLQGCNLNKCGELYFISGKIKESRGRRNHSVCLNGRTI